jgi:hypothetical protein
MPIVMNMRWAGVTPEQYDAARETVHWEGDVPEGALYHVASFAEDGVLYVTDVWETADQFQRFVETRLMPGVQRVGIAGEPDVEIRPVHAIFAPGYRVELPPQRDSAASHTASGVS